MQFTRIFSNFQVEYGRDPDTGLPTLLRVPVRYGDASRQAQTIIQQNSASSLPSTPLMTFYITGFNYARDRLQEPYHVNKIAVRQRTYDTATETYETTQGNAFTIERLMPVPYNLEIGLDIWTSNTNQKMQLLEQIVTLFNPALEIQSTDNYIDWTSLSVVELESVNWSSRTIPQGTEDTIDIASLKFTLPIWISPPAKVKKLGVVTKIIASMYNSRGDPIDALTNNDLLLGTRQRITPYAYQTLLIGNQLQVLKYSQPIDESNFSLLIPQNPPSNVMWRAVVGLYGTLREGISQIRLETEDGTEIVGTVSYHPSDDRFILFDVDIDTIPENTQAPLTAIIDPGRSGPGAGLPAAAKGQRYLLTEDLGSVDNTALTAPSAWFSNVPIVAKANDIIEFDGGSWHISFNGQIERDIQYVTNSNTNIQYRWTGNEWVKSYEGLYVGGRWSLVL